MASDSLFLSAPLEKFYTVVLPIWSLMGACGGGFEGDSVLKIDVGGTYFFLGRLSHDIYHDIENSVYGYIIWWVV